MVCCFMQGLVPPTTARSAVISGIHRCFMEVYRQGSKAVSSSQRYSLLLHRRDVLSISIACVISGRYFIEVNRYSPADT